MGTHQKFGSKPWVKLLRPAMELADQGFATDSSFIRRRRSRATRREFPASAALFLRGGKFNRCRVDLAQPDWPKCCGGSRRRGRDGFYTGEDGGADRDAMKRSGGIISTRTSRISGDLARAAGVRATAGITCLDASRVERRADARADREHFERCDLHR